MSALLSLSNVTKRFGGLLAVNSMTFDLQEGEVVGLLGPNGSGKTTLINLISGALPPSAGSVHVAGKEIAGLRAGIRSPAPVSPALFNWCGSCPA